LISVLKDLTVLFRPKMFHNCILFSKFKDIAPPERFYRLCVLSASCSVVPPILLACLEVKRPGHEADHSPAPSAEVKNGFIRVPTCLHKLSWRDAKLCTGQFTFTHSIALMCLCMCMCFCVMLLTH